MIQIICDRCGKKLKEKDNYNYLLINKYGNNTNVIAVRDLCKSCSDKIIDKLLDLIKKEIDDGISIHEVMERDKNSIRLSYDEDTVTKKG